MDKIPVIQRVVAILWPSFITAGIATVLFTTAFDPEIIPDGHPLNTRPDPGFDYDEDFEEEDYE